jgi:hypothetical protein
MTIVRRRPSSRSQPGAATARSPGERSDYFRELLRPVKEPVIVRDDDPAVGDLRAAAVGRKRDYASLTRIYRR